MSKRKIRAMYRQNWKLLALFGLIALSTYHSLNVVS